MYCSFAQRARHLERDKRRPNRAPICKSPYEDKYLLPSPSIQASDIIPDLIIEQPRRHLRISGFKQRDGILQQSLGFVDTDLAAERLLQEADNHPVRLDPLIISRQHIKIDERNPAFLARDRLDFRFERFVSIELLYILQVIDSVLLQHLAETVNSFRLKIPFVGDVLWRFLNTSLT